MEELSIRAYARHRGCHPSLIGRFLQQGKIPRTPSGKIDPVAADAALECNVRRRAAKRPPEVVSTTIPPHTNVQNGDFITLGEAERRRVLADAQQRELKLAVAMGRLVDAQAAEAAWSEIVGDIRTRLLALPAKLTQRLFGCSDRLKFQEMVKDEIADALEVIGRGK